MNLDIPHSFHKYQLTIDQTPKSKMYNYKTSGKKITGWNIHLLGFGSEILYTNHKTKMIHEQKIWQNGF